MRKREPEPLASMPFDAERPEEVQAFLKRAWNELRTLRCVRVWPDRFRVYDVNGDCFEVTGVGYSDPQIHLLLDAVYAAYDRDAIGDPIDAPYKEFLTGRRYPWAQDRVM